MKWGVQRGHRLLLTGAISVLLILAGSVLGQAAPKPLSADEIEKLLRAGVTPTRVASLINEKGITFEATAAVKTKLREAGAGDDVIAAVERAGAEVVRRKQAEEEQHGKEVGARQQQTAAEAKPTSTEPRERDGMVFVPAGPFFMGCNEKVDSECDADEKPGKTVDVKAFWIDKTEVRVADYRRCVEAGRCSDSGLSTAFFDGNEQPNWSPYCNWEKSDRGEHPINCVNWDQAVAYCEWRGKRLPAEVQWEKAARGTDGRKYPWGNTGYGAASRVANIADQTAKRRYPSWESATGYDDAYLDTAPVGSFPKGASPYGALDMVGNVWEWTRDSLGEERGVRGGSWNDVPRAARASYRNRVGPATRYPHYGFRCVQ